MDLTQFSEIGASGFICLIIVIFAVLGFVKGIFKLIYSLVCLVGTFAAAYFGHTWGAQQVHNNWDNVPEHTEVACAVVAGILAFMILKGFTGFLSNPFGKDDDEKKKTGLGFLGSLAGIAIAIFICWAGMQKLIDSGARAEIGYWVSQAKEGAPTDLPALSRLKKAFTKSLIGKEIAKFYPLDESVEQRLAKLTVMRVTSSDQFKELATHPTIKETLLDPKVLHFMMNKEVVADIENGNVDALLEHPEFKDLITDPALKAAIAEIDIEQALKLR